MSRSATDRKPAFEQFSAARRYQPTLSFSPDGAEIVYSTNISGQFNIWRQSTAGGYAHQVTAFTDEAVRDIAWSPDGETLLFTADHHGNEQYQIHVVAPRDGWPEQIQSEPDVQHYLGKWSPDGKSYAYAANDREPTDQDIMVRNAETGEVVRVLAGGNTYIPMYWSPDGTKLTAIALLSNTNVAIHLIDVVTGETEELNPHDDDIKQVPVDWARDGSGFYIVSDEGREFTGLGFFALTTRAIDWIETPNWDIEGCGLSRDGRVLTWYVNEDGYSRHYARNLELGEAIAIPAIPAGVTVSMTLSDDGTKLGLLHATATHPGEVYLVDIPGETVQRLTDGFLGGIPEASMVSPELVRFNTFDGKQIPAFLYKPNGEGPFGVVLSLHGGPEAQEQPLYAYNGLYQYWLSRGIAVLAPNVRGSTGYGKSYQKLIHRDFGGDDLKDFEAAVTYLHSLPWVDRARIGVFGGSYGGFATLSCVTRLPDYWAAAVDIVGPSNLVTFAKAVPPTWRRFMASWVGDPYTEEEFLLARSPITYVDQIKAPLFVIQGANDPRVVKAESDQIVERLRERGVDVRYDVYEDEGHGFTKRHNELKALKDTAEFLEKYLAG